MDSRSQKYFAHYSSVPLDYLHQVSQRLPVTNVATVIPLREETTASIDSLYKSLLRSASLADQPCLAIFVVNERESDSSDVRVANQASLDWFVKSGAQPISSETLLLRQENLVCLVMNRTSQTTPLPNKEGVGLARKIGNDFTAFCTKSGCIKHHVFGNTDGDAQVPENYFLRLLELSAYQAGAWIFPFRHIPGGDGDVDLQTQIYESYLHYYVAGLRYAGSPYSYIALGSAICLTDDAYIAVRGHPKKLAGEDFYILNKINKIDQVVTLEGEPIQLTSRLSDRVPFGTGQAVTVMTKEIELGYKIYDPRCFDGLKAFLEASLHCLANAETTAPSRLKYLTPDQSQHIFASIGFDKLWQKIIAAPENQRVKRFHEMFDALRTLQLIHVLRDTVWPSIDWQEAIMAFSQKSKHLIHTEIL